MRTKFIKISIPEPCKEDWTKMTPKDKGRFCSSCSKTVVDFTKMNNTEIAEHLSENSNICGHINTKQLDNYYALPRKEKFKLARFAAACLLVFGLGLFNYSCEYESPKVQLIELVEQNKNIHDTIKDVEQKDSTKLNYTSTTKGKIEQSCTTPEIEGQIELTGEVDEMIMGDFISTDETVTVTRDSFKVEEYTPQNPFKNMDTNVHHLISGGISAQTFYRGEVEVQPILEPNENSIEPKIQLYPNPTNNKLNFVYTPVKNSSTEVLNVEILNTMGRIVLKTNIDKRNGSFYKAINVRELSAGNYIVNFIEGDKTYSDHLVISN